MRKIYDCFTFYNEFDLLEIRLKELYNTVDHFVLVESNQTFTNRIKPFLFEENQDRYSQYLDKIIHVKVDDMPNSGNPWDNEIHQRNSIMRGLTDAALEDIIVVSDCDEVLRARAIETLKYSDHNLFALRMPLFNFKFNYMRVNPGEYDCWAMACTREVLNNNTPDSLRNHRHNLTGCTIVEHAGWHFGYLGDKNYLVDKAQSFSHQEVNTPEFFDQLDIEASIKERKEWNRQQTARYEIVRLDDYFPASVKNYPQFILDNTDISPYNILPPFPYK
jgi:hypothetical protein